MKSIGLIVTCYYGSPGPAWLDLFFETCRWNPSIEFLVLTDTPSTQRWEAPNIHVHVIGIPELQRRASERLGMDVALHSPYKLIDFRPAYGVIFEDLLAEFDFFGYCDADLVFGDIRARFDETTLEAHDVFFSRPEFPTGHFSLFRRGFERLYERSRDFEKIFTTTKNYAFDECGMGLHRRLLLGAPFAYIAEDAYIDSLMHVLTRSTDVRTCYRLLCDEYLPEIGRLRVIRQEVRWARGKLHDTRTGRELMYYHLQCLKQFPSFYVPRWDTPPPAFQLNRLGAFWDGPSPPPRSLWRLLDRPRYFLSEWISILSGRRSNPTGASAVDIDATSA